MSEHLASVKEIVNSQSKKVDKIEKDVGDMKVELAVVLIRVNKVLDQLGE